MARQFLGLALGLALTSLALANRDEHQSLRHIQKRHQIQMERDFGSKEHSDIRRSMNQIKNRETLKRDDPLTSSEVIKSGDGSKIPDKFDQPTYDFMLPEGRSEKPTILALIDFITSKNNEAPEFQVNFDEQKWFDIGSVRKSKADNADVYHATVILRAGADVRIVNATENGIYRFVVEATNGDLILASTNILVEVVALNPTTIRSKNVLSVSSTIPTILEASGDDVITLESTTTASLLNIEGSGNSIMEDGSGVGIISTEVQTTSDSSAELLTEESPISGGITILPLKSDRKEEEIEVDGDEDDDEDEAEDPEDIDIVIKSKKGYRLISLEGARKKGDIIADAEIRIKSDISNSDSRVDLIIEPNEFFTIRPKRVRVGETAALFLVKPLTSQSGKELNVEITARLPNGAMIRRPIEFEGSEKVDDDHINEAENLGKLQEIEFSVTENAESGKTVGQIDGEMKIVGESKRFSIIGNDIILTCQQFEDDNCLKSDEQKEFSLILLPINGSLSPIIQATIRVQQSANLRTSDDIIRISDNRIISPFAIIVERSRKEVRLTGGEAAKFLGVQKSQDGLWQILIKNSAPTGQYSLEIGLNGVETPRKIVKVMVTNSLNHAHFRQEKYKVEKLDASKMEKNQKLIQVELEGVPIDEAAIVILDGNPGWITVEGYGGRVKIGEYNGNIYNGKYVVTIGAVDKKTWNILTETKIEVEVENGAEKKLEKLKNDEQNVVMEHIFNREDTKQFRIRIDESDDDNSAAFEIEPASIFGIDEYGKKISLSPKIFKISENHVDIEDDPLRTLRIVSFTLKSEGSDETLRAKKTILMRLISSPKYLEKLRKLEARPVFPEPWSRENNEIQVELPEELLPGQVVGVFPAMIPTNYETSEVVIESDMKEAFDFDSKSGQLRIRQRIDFESLNDQQRQFDLRLISGDKGFESIAILKIKVIDVDDKSPTIMEDTVDTIFLPEDLQPSSKIAEFKIKDSDGSGKFSVKLLGRGNEYYEANIAPDGVLTIKLSKTKKLDRETQSSHCLIVQVSDESDNWNQIVIPIQVTDVNDNPPLFDKSKYEVEAVEDWPVGVVLTRVSAEDPDLDRSAQIVYSIDEKSNTNILKINETTGIVTINNELYGLARAEPYNIQIRADDLGKPPMSSLTTLKLRVRSAEEMINEPFVEISEPKNGFVLKVKENISNDVKIFTGKAEVKGVRNRHTEVVYSLKDLTSDENQPAFDIDKKTGDIFASDALDYEKVTEYTLLMTATDSEDAATMSSMIFKVEIQNIDDNEPQFLESASPIFRIPSNSTKATSIGRIVAVDLDNDPIYYRIIPRCGSTAEMSNFQVDVDFGELIYHRQKSIDDRDVKRMEICVIATSSKDLDVSDVIFDATAKNMKKIVVVVADENSELNDSQKFIARNNSVITVGNSLERVEIPINTNSKNFNLESINFVPAAYDLGRDFASPQGAVELNTKVGDLVANTRIFDAPQGVYTATIRRGTTRAIKQLHHVKDERKLRYVLAMTPNEFGANREKLIRQIHEALNSENNIDNKYRIYFNSPIADSKNSSWTNVCFYLTKKNEILDDKQMTSLLSDTNGHVTKLHHIFKVINIEKCESNAGSSSGSSSSASDVSSNTLILISIVALLVIVLIALLIYICCVATYRRRIEQRIEKLRRPASSATGSYYKSPGYFGTPDRIIHSPHSSAISYY